MHAVVVLSLAIAILSFEDIRIEAERFTSSLHWPTEVPRPRDEWEFERAGAYRLVKGPRMRVTADRQEMIDTAVAGRGLMRIGMFDPAFITSGRLRKVLDKWGCKGRQPICALFRRSAARSR